MIAGLLGSDYRPDQMTYDLRRLRLAGLLRRIEHINRYQLTSDGIRIASPALTNPRCYPSYAKPCASSTARRQLPLTTPDSRPAA